MPQPSGDMCRPPSWELFKRGMDLVITGGLVAVLGPMMAAIAWWVRRDSPGPAIFRQRRAGRGGRPFVLLKFRTMRTDADPYGDSPRDGADPRLTRIGRWLREHSLDELPQLLNVLRGDMSLVGPRPLYVQQIAEWTDWQRRRLAVKPGLTGLAQVAGRGALTREDKLALDVEYVMTRSTRLDLRLLWQTLAGGWRAEGIYEVRYSQDRVQRGGDE